jgi:hypothetical protein
MFFLICLISAPAQTAGAAGAPPALIARETGVAVYAVQDAETDRIATLEKGEALFPMVEAVGAETWYMVRTKQGLIGWVRAADVVADHWHLERCAQFDPAIGKRRLDAERRQRRHYHARRLGRRQT